MLPKKLMCTVPFCLIGLLAISLLTTAAGLEVEEKEIKPTTPTTLMIPSVEEVRANGYPVNEQGQTYGPDIRENTNIEEAPDLILVCNEFGEEGYIRSTDCDAGASTLEEAANWEPREYSVNMYLQDGLTIIGQFKIG